MKKNKIYKITIIDIITSLIGSIIVISVFTPILILIITTINNSTDIEDIWIVIFVCLGYLFVVTCYGIFPIYLCWSYYQKEKNVTIFIDYEKAELQYIEKDKEIQYIKFEDIDIIESHGKLRIGLWYYKIILNNGNSIIITSLIADVYNLFPNNLHYELEHSAKLLLPRN